MSVVVVCEDENGGSTGRQAAGGRSVSQCGGSGRPFSSAAMWLMAATQQSRWSYCRRPMSTPKDSLQCDTAAIQ